MKLALILSGVVAAVAVAVPSLVVLGYIAFIIPGLILTLAPTIFVYLAATMIIRALLPLSPGVSTNFIAFVVSLALGWAAMQPFRALEIAEYEAVLKPDIVPEKPSTLSGHIRLDVPARPGRRNTQPACDHICAALLDLPGVRTVTEVREGEGATFALLEDDEFPGAGLFPLDPGKLIHKLPGPKKFKESQIAARALEAHWALRLATSERLVSHRAKPESESDWIVRQTSERSRGEPTVHRIEIFDSAGTCRFRKSYVRDEVPERVFHFGFNAGSAAGGFSGAGFHVGRQTLESGSVELSSDLEPALLEAIDLRAPSVGKDTLDTLRAEVIAAIEDPGASAARLELPRRWLSQFWFNAEKSDYVLIARIVAEPRVRDLGEPLANVFRKGQTPIAMREAYAQRILMDHTSEKDRRVLASALASMPPGAFSHPAPAHLTIWTDAELCLQAAPFVARLADLGGDTATPVILTALESSLSLEPWNKRRPLIEGVRDALVRLGPEAASVAPRIRELFLQRPSPIMNNSGDADDWRFALVRMGVAIDDLPFFPNQNEPMISRIKQRVRARLKKYASENPHGQGAER